MSDYGPIIPRGDAVAPTPHVAVPVDRLEVLKAIANERERQITKWGPQSHPDGTVSDETSRALRDLFRSICDEQAKDPGSDSWLNILREEVYEAFAEVDWPALRKELIQSAAVIVAWVEDGDRR